MRIRMFGNNQLVAREDHVRMRKVYMSLLGNLRRGLTFNIHMELDSRKRLQALSRRRGMPAKGGVTNEIWSQSFHEHDILRVQSWDVMVCVSKNCPIWVPLVGRSHHRYHRNGRIMECADFL